MRSLAASLAALSIVGGFAVSAFANEPPEPVAKLQPLDATQLDELRAGLQLGHGITHSYRDLGPGPSGSVATELQKIVVLALTRTAKHAGGDGIRGRIPGGGMTQIDPPSLQLDAGTLEAWGRAGLRYSYRQTDFDFVRRVAERLRHRDR